MSSKSMGCTISSYNSIQSASAASARQNAASESLPFSSESTDAMITQPSDGNGQSSDVDSLGVKLQRFSVGTAEPQATASIDGDLQEDDSTSSSSESSAGLPSELHPADGTRRGPLETLAPAAPAPSDAAVGLLYDQSMEQHLGPDHFERPARIIALHATLQEQGLMGRCWQLVPRQATDEELLLGHSQEHIRKVDAMFSELYPARPDTLTDAEYCYADGRMGDVYICAGTARAARTAAGCCVQAVQSVLCGSVARAMAVVRPPGHHAECERAMGFCFFNNVAVAALVALQQPGVRRVAVLDWDVHHGNGIQNMLLQRPDALYISIHRDPKRFYPYTSGFLAEAGEGAGTGFNVNVPWLKKGMGDGDYRAAFALVVEPLLESYQPDLVIVAAGFDAADGDPLGGCKVSPEGYGWMTERLMRFAGGRLVLALEGGYNNRVTSWCAAACVRALLEGRAAPELPTDKEHLWPSEGHNSLKLVYEFQRQHWPVLRSKSWTEAWEGHLKDVHRMLGANARSKRSSAGGAGNGNSNSTSSQSPPPATTASGGGADGASAAAERAEALTSLGGGTSSGPGRRSTGSGSGGGGDGPPRPPAPHSLQEAFKARKAARESATAVIETPERGAAVPVPVIVANTASGQAGHDVAVETVPAAPPPPLLPQTAAAIGSRQSSSDCATSSSSTASATHDGGSGSSNSNNVSGCIASSAKTHGSVAAASLRSAAGSGLAGSNGSCGGGIGATGGADGSCGGGGGGGGSDSQRLTTTR